MIVIIWICAGILVLAAALLLIRMTRGPSMLDRAVSMDVLLAVVICALALEAAANQHTTTLPVLLVLALVGFVGSVSLARFAARDVDVDEPPETEPDSPHTATSEGSR